MEGRAARSAGAISGRLRKNHCSRLKFGTFPRTLDKREHTLASVSVGSREVPNGAHGVGQGPVLVQSAGPSNRGPV